jgi:uncharacterized sulfatase
MKPGLASLTVLYLAVSATLCAADLPRSSEKLNVLFILSDDFRDVGGAFTKARVKLPNLDRLATRGVRFQNAFVQYPVCNPSRCSFLTGLRSEQTGVTDNVTMLRSRLPDVVTLPQLFKGSGWHTESFGKIFHVGGAKREPNREAGGKGAAWMDLPKSWHAAVDFQPTSAGRQILEGRNLTGGRFAWCHWGMAAGNDDDQPDGQTAQAVVKLIEQQGSHAWFIGCGFHKPHDPFIAPKKYFDLYPPAELRLWRDPAGMTPAPAMALPAGTLAEFRRFTDVERLEFLRAYCAAASYMDAQLGRVLDALDRGKLWDKTIVIFAGDNGYHTGERDWWNKDTLFDRSCRAPLIIAAPGGVRGVTCRSLVEFVDLYPTIAEMCGITPPAGLAGKSIRPLLVDPAAKVNDAAFTLVTRGPKGFGQSVRTQRWRFTQWTGGAQELYDHENDPEENCNVARLHPDVVAELAAKLKTLPPYPSKP